MSQIDNIDNAEQSLTIESLTVEPLAEERGNDEVWFDASGMHYADEQFKGDEILIQDEIMSDLEPASVQSADVHGEDDPELLAAQKPNRRLKIPQFNIPKIHVYSLLVFEAGSFGLRGALVKNTKHTAIVGAVAESSQVDFTRAITDVLNQLKQHQKSLPRRAILLTPSVISSLVELPVSPLRPRSDSEMQELIRWELEGEMNQQNKRWLIGSMLVERGYLTVTQRDELVTELQVRLSQSAPGEVIRFGDLAVEFNYITPSQLQECFSLQGKLSAVDDELVFGWQAEELPLDTGPTDESLMSAEDDRESAHRWLVSGMSKSLRRRWVGAFALNNIRLDALYPSVGACYATLSQYTAEPIQALIEVHQEQLAFVCGSVTGVRQLRIVERLQGDLRADEVLPLLRDLPDGVSTVYLNTQGQLIDELLFTLRTELDYDYQILSLEGIGIIKPETLHADKLAGLTGVAGHHFKHISQARLSPVSARDKEPAFWQRLLQPKVMKLIAAGLVSSVMVGFMVWMYWNMGQQTDRLAGLEGQYERDMTLKSQYSRIASEQTLLKQQIDQLATEKKLNQKLLYFVVSEKPRRAVALPVLMKAISLHTPHGVALLAVRRIGKETEIEAESASQTEGLEFISGLNKQLEPLAFQVKTSRIYQKDDEDNKTRKTSAIDTGLPYRVELVVIESPPLRIEAIVDLMSADESDVAKGTTAKKGDI